MNSEPRIEQRVIGVQSTLEDTSDVVGTGLANICYGSSHRFGVEIRCYGAASHGDAYAAARLAVLHRDANDFGGGE